MAGGASSNRLGCPPEPALTPPLSSPGISISVGTSQVAKVLHRNGLPTQVIASRINPTMCVSVGGGLFQKLRITFLSGKQVMNPPESVRSALPAYFPLMACEQTPSLFPAFATAFQPFQFPYFSILFFFLCRQFPIFLISFFLF